MIKIKDILMILAVVVFLSACSFKQEKEQENKVSYDYESIKKSYNDQIAKYYSELEDYKKNEAEIVYFDIDGNSVPELLLKTWNGGYEVYTADNKKLYKSGILSTPLYRSPDGKLVCIEDFGDSNEGCREYSLENNILRSEVIFSRNSDGTENVPEVDGDAVHKDYNMLKSEYSANEIKGESVSDNIDNLDELFPKQ